MTREYISSSLVSYSVITATDDIPTTGHSKFIDYHSTPMNIPFDSGNDKITSYDMAKLLSVLLMRRMD